MTRTPKAEIRTDERGVVFVEFLIALVPVWTFSLCAFQLSLISVANLVAKHAADSAARSASVVLADDPSEYGGEPKRSVERSPRALSNRRKSRLNTIRLAAYVPLMPLSSRGTGFDPRPTLGGAIPSMRALGTALLRAPPEVAVTFPGAAGQHVQGLEATVRVTYAYECLVPIARRLLCSTRDAFENEPELAHAALSLLRKLGPGRFRVLTHQTTLLIHDAPYEYRSRGS